MSLLQPLESGLSPRLLGSYILGSTSLLIAEHNLPSGGSLDCVVKGANNSTATLLTPCVGRFELAL